MRSCRSAFVASLATASLLACESTPPLEPSPSPGAASLAKGGAGGGTGGGTQFATLSRLPALASAVHGEPYAVDGPGSTVVGYSWDRAGYMHPVTWTAPQGSWVITALPIPAGLISATARAVNDAGDVAGHSVPGTLHQPLFWPRAGGVTLLGCGERGDVHAMSAGAQIAAGVEQTSRRAMLWRPGSCGEALPSLEDGAGSLARAVNRDGTVVGGHAGVSTTPGGSVPVRWRRAGGAWTIEQLDTRIGTVTSANRAGDLVGHVAVPCSSAGTCQLGVVWYADGSSRTLGSLGGEYTVPRGINMSGEVVGLSRLSNGTGQPFIWSPSWGMRRISTSGDGGANAVSEVRADGTRIVTGYGGWGALAWVVRNP